MSQDIAGVYSDARSEYTKQLCGILIPSYFKVYLELLEKAKEEATKTNEPKKVLWHFQTFLNEIPEWNMEKVSTEISHLQNGCGCDYMDDLLTAVFIAHTKVLTAIRISSKQKKVQITVPKVEHFLFKVLCETSKLLWGSSFLFRDGIPSIEKQQNYRAIEGLLGEGILQAIRNMVPVKNILKDFVSHDDEDDEEEEPKEEEEQKEEKEQKDEPKEEKKENELMIPELPIGVSGETVATVATVATVHPVLKALSALPSPSIPEPVGVSGETVPQIIINTEKHSVGFSDYKSMFDSDNPNESDIVLDNQEEDISDDLEIMDGPGVPLDADDVEEFGIAPSAPERIGDGDYDVLV